MSITPGTGTGRDKKFNPPQPQDAPEELVVSLIRQEPQNLQPTSQLAKIKPKNPLEAQFIPLGKHASPQPQKMFVNGDIFEGDTFQGNLFQDYWVMYPNDRKDLGPFETGLNKAQRRFAEENGEAPKVHEFIVKRGWRDPQGKTLNGQGITIGYIDDYHEGAQKPVTPHPDSVRGVIKDPKYGIAPGAETIVFGLKKGGYWVPPASFMRIWKMPDTSQALDETVDEMSSDVLKTVTIRLDQLRGDLHRYPAMRVLNISMGKSRFDFYNTVKLVMMDKDKFPTLRKTILGSDADQLSEAEVSGKIVAYVNKRLENPDSAFQKALRDYQRASEAIEKAGILTVVAIGNDHFKKTDTDQFPPGFDTNILTMSPHVIGVTGSYSNQTPGFGNRGDDKIAYFSSRGDGKTWNPFISAPGFLIPLSDRELQHTSFATPFVSGTAALLFQAKPSLSPAEVRELIKSTATDIIPGQMHDGHGVINPEGALQKIFQP